MAKEKETKKAEITVENIDDVINNGSVVTEEVAKAAAEELAKRRKEQVTKELIEITQQADYTRKRTFLSAKKSKKVAEIKMNYLKKYSELHDKLISGDASLSIDEFKKRLNEELNTANKLIREVEVWYDEKCDALDNQYPGCWSWSLRRYVI